MMHNDVARYYLVNHVDEISNSLGKDQLEMTEKIYCISTNQYYELPGKGSKFLLSTRMKSSWVILR
jgi:hypothetical protein